jgi:hypothetical protein
MSILPRLRYLCGRAAVATAVRVVARHVRRHHDRFGGAPYLAGRCNVCGKHTLFFCPDQRLFRESLHCAECGATSRYRSIAKGVLRAVRELAGVDARSVAELSGRRGARPLRVYDAQTASDTYRIPALLAACDWIDVRC